MSINEIDVVGLQDNFTNPSEPTATMVSANYANKDFQVQYWDGSAWVIVPGGYVTDNNLVWRKFTFSPVTTNKIRVVFTRVTAAVAYLTELEAWGHVTAPPTNVALASNVGTPSASGTYANNSNYDIAAVTNGERKGLPFSGNSGYWASSPYVSPSNPQWAEVSFSTARSINEIDVFGPQDDFSNPVEPTPTLVSNNYANKDFQVQYWDGSAWVTVPGGDVTDNNLVWRKFTFSPITTNRIRVVFTRTTAIVAYLTELEAWTSDTGGAAGNVHWLVADHLGTPRMIFDQTGSLANVSRHDYLPFGEEVPADFRTGIPGYGASDNVRQKFTQKERDNETGLDYFLARYYSSTQGRFTSVDPVMSYAGVVSPQSWNRYGYALGNPLAFVDRNGKWPTWIHDTIIEGALPGLSQTELIHIKIGSYWVDLYGTRVGGTLAESNANEHAMRMPGQSFDQALAGYYSFIASKSSEAITLEESATTGVAGEQAHLASLRAFGAATHAPTDNISPAHSGMQVYHGAPPTFGDPISSILWVRWLLDLKAHRTGESQITRDQLNTAIQVVREQYRGIYGERKSQRAIGGGDFWGGFWNLRPQIDNLRVMAIVTVYPDGTAHAQGPNLKQHPKKVPH